MASRVWIKIMVLKSYPENNNKEEFNQKKNMLINKLVRKRNREK